MANLNDLTKLQRAILTGMSLGPALVDNPWFREAMREHEDYNEALMTIADIYQLTYPQTIARLIRWMEAEGYGWRTCRELALRDAGVARRYMLEKGDA